MEHAYAVMLDSRNQAWMQETNITVSMDSRLPEVLQRAYYPQGLPQTGQSAS